MNNCFVSINQPTFLPWIGYFDLIDMSDLFVFLDDVKFSRHSWHQRNKIAGQENNWLTIPIRKGSSSLKLNEISLGLDQKTRSKILNKLANFYKKTPYFDYYFPFFENSLSSALNPKYTLAQLNIEIIKFLLKEFSINTKTIRSSDINADGDRSKKLIGIITSTGHQNYLSPLGSKDYLITDRTDFERSNIVVYLQQYRPQWYGGDDWQPYLSAVDLLFRFGSKSREIMLAGRSKPLSLIR